MPAPEENLRVSGDGVAIAFEAASYAAAGGAVLVSDINLQVRTGETLVLLGRSGSGKSTTLKLINRMLDPTAGEVRVLGKPTRAWEATELRRRIGYVIQDVGLFPHRTVARNVETVPRLLGWERERMAARVDELLRLLGMPPEQFRDRYPHQLSGGQRQRVGLARALAADPPVLLMDEPFGALDPLTRSEVEAEFHQLQARLKKTVVLVTHDLIEALALADRIAMLDASRVIGQYTREEFFSADDRVSRAYRASLRAAEPVLAQMREQPGA